MESMNKLKRYNFPIDIMKKVEPIISFIQKDKINEAEIAIANLTLDLCTEIEGNRISPKYGDDCFTLLDLFITDNYSELDLSKEIKDIIFEGMILHDYGTEYGADLLLMKDLANKVKE